MVSVRKSIAYGGAPGELKHLITRRKRKKTIDSLSSGERKGKSLNRCIAICIAGLRARVIMTAAEQNDLESSVKEGDNPVGESDLVRRVPEYHRTRGIRWEHGRTIS